MKKSLCAILLALVSLGFLPSCAGRKEKDCTPKEVCKTRYAYDDCNACYELDAQADVQADAQADEHMINKF